MNYAMIVILSPVSMNPNASQSAYGDTFNMLIEKLAEIHAEVFSYEKSLSEEELIKFIEIEYSRIGADKNITPREVIRDFIELLNILCQNPALNIAELLMSEQFEYSKSEVDSEQVAEEFAEFEI